MKLFREQQPLLMIGDLVAILIVTWIGFLSHYGNLQGWRWLTTYLPVLVGWFVMAPWLGVYQADLAGDFRSVWRPALAAFLAAPLAATLRGLWLNAAILPIFVIVLGLTNALGMLIWRFIWVGVQRWRMHRASGLASRTGGADHG